MFASIKIESKPLVQLHRTHDYKKYDFQNQAKNQLYVYPPTFLKNKFFDEVPPQIHEKVNNDSTNDFLLYYYSLLKWLICSEKFFHRKFLIRIENTNPGARKLNSRLGHDLALQSNNVTCATIYLTASGKLAPLDYSNNAYES